MSNLIAAAETIDRLAVMFQGMVEASAALKAIGSLEQATAEAVAARAEAVAARAEAVAAHEAEMADFENRKSVAIVDLSNLAHEADRMREQAKAEADKIVSGARAAAAAELEAAKSQIAATADAHTALESAAHARLNAINVDIANATTKHDQAVADAADAQSKLDAIRASIAALTKG